MRQFYLTFPKRDALRLELSWIPYWPGGITNPLTLIEQISYLMIACMLDVGTSKSAPLLL